MLPFPATKAFLASDKGLATAFVGLFTAGVTYVAVTIDGSGMGAGSSPSFTLVSASHEDAVLGAGDGLRRVSVGTVVPTLGQVVRIEWTDGHWAVVFATGKVLTTTKTTGFALRMGS